MKTLQIFEIWSVENSFGLRPISFFEFNPLPQHPYRDKKEKGLIFGQPLSFICNVNVLRF
jgi:hypothetical protein